MDQAIIQRDDWLRQALCTLPADRPAAEAAITELYRLVGHAGAPRFIWVDSPVAAAAVAASEGLRRDRIPIPAPERASDWPLSSRLATLTSSLRHGLDERVRRRHQGRPAFWWWSDPAVRRVRVIPPQESLRDGVDLGRVLRATVRDSLHDSIHESLGGLLRTAVAREAGGVLGLTWYGQHDAHWVADFDIWRALGHVFSARRHAELDLWVTLARSCGWWWPYEGACLVSERPAVVHTEPVPGAVHGEVRPHSDQGMALRYGDGWGVHAWHGTLVPDWVINEPTVDRIAAELNVEVRRCAIERIGWDVYIEQAGLNLVSVAADPGNPGCELRLYDMPVWGARTRILLAVNGSVERDGHRRRYGLSVPADIDDPVGAAGWSYGLTGEQYARLLRRT